jgi:hypothetical protein
VTEARRLVWLDRAALATAAVLALALAAVWAWDRSRPVPTIAWDGARFVALVPADSIAPGRERWIVAVQPACPTCGRHVRDLTARLATRVHPPALGVLVVDERARPAAPRAPRLSAGVWWDSAGLWRREWRRRRYGETYRFDAGGRLLGATPAGVLPDSVAAAP